MLTLFYMDSFLFSCALSNNYSPVIPSQQSHFTLSSIHFTMPSTWSKPYTSILIENAPLWIEAKTTDNCKAVAEVVAKKIIDQVNKDGNDHIEELEKGSLYCTFCQFISLTFFRKLKIGTTTNLGQRRRRTSWPPKDMRRRLSQ